MNDQTLSGKLSFIPEQDNTNPLDLVNELHDRSQQMEHKDDFPVAKDVNATPKVVTVDAFLPKAPSKSQDQYLGRDSEDDLITGTGEFVCMGKSKKKMEFSKKIKFY